MKTAAFWDPTTSSFGKYYLFRKNVISIYQSPWSNLSKYYNLEILLDDRDEELNERSI